jgi:hypothetical protein
MQVANILNNKNARIIRDLLREYKKKLSIQQKNSTNPRIIA